MPSFAGGEWAPYDIRIVLGYTGYLAPRILTSPSSGLGQGKTESREIPYSFCGR